MTGRAAHLHSASLQSVGATHAAGDDDAGDSVASAAGAAADAAKSALCSSSALGDAADAANFAAQAVQAVKAGYLPCPVLCLDMMSPSGQSSHAVPNADATGCSLVPFACSFPGHQCQLCWLSANALSPGRM